MNAAANRLRTLVLCLVVTLLAGTGVAQAGSGSSIAKLVPDDTQALVSFDVQGLRQSAFWPDIKDILNRGSALSDLDKQVPGARKAILNNLQAVTLAFPKGFDDSKEFIMYVEGRGLESLIRSATKKEGKALRNKKYRGFAYVANEEFAMLSLGSILVLSEAPNVEKVIDLHAGRTRSLAESKESRALLGRIDTNAEVWLAILDSSGMGGGVPFDDVAVSVALRNGLGLELDIGFNNTAAADEVVKGFNELRSEGADPALASLGLGTAMKKVQLNQRAERVHMSLGLTPTELKELEPAWNIVKGSF